MSENRHETVGQVHFGLTARPATGSSLDPFESGTWRLWSLTSVKAVVRNGRSDRALALTVAAPFMPYWWNAG
jgi:hypothetical protein